MSHPINTNLLDAVSQTWLQRPGVLVFDIDGCCVDQTIRGEEFAEHKDSLKYHADFGKDRAIIAGTVVYTALLRMPNLRPIFLTSRSSVTEVYTRAQLQSLFDLKDDQYELVTKGEAYRYMSDSEFKIKALHDLGIEPQHIIVAFDDRPSVIEAYRKLGITAYQTAKGW